MASSVSRTIGHGTAFGIDLSEYGFHRPRYAVRSEERISAVRRTVDDVEGHVEARLFVRPLQLVRLVDRHLWILIAMKHEERGIVRANVRDRAGELGELWYGVWLRAEQEIEGRLAHAQPVRRRLREDGRQVRRAVVVDDRSDTGGLTWILPHRPFESLLAITDADERRKVAAGGRAGDGNAIDAIAVVACLGAEKPDRSLDVMHLRWKARLDRLPEVEAGERVAVLDEGHGRLRPGPRAPGSTVYPHDERWRLYACWQIEIERERLAVNYGVGDVLVHAAVLGVQGQRKKEETESAAERSHH